MNGGLPIDDAVDPRMGSLSLRNRRSVRAYDDVSPGMTRSLDGGLTIRLANALPNITAAKRDGAHGKAP
jgi:hypothetical protein